MRKLNIDAAKTPFEIVPPDDTPEYMYDAYFSCFFWAIKFAPILQEFLKDTGLSIPTPPRNGLDAMIDAATGHNPYEHFVRAFVPWFNRWVWGKMDGEGPDE